MHWKLYVNNASLWCRNPDLFEPFIDKVTVDDEIKIGIKESLIISNDSLNFRTMNLIMAK